CQDYGCLKPTWLTELGWPTGAHLAVTEQTQAEYLVKAYIMALAVPGLDKCFWYDFRDDAADPSYWESNLGLLRQDMSPKPAYLAFATMTRLLHGYDYLGPIDLSAASVAVPLDLSGSPVHVHRDGDEIVLDLTLSDEPEKTVRDVPIHRLLPGEPTGLAMEVHADASDNLIGARVRDAGGREFMGDLEYLNWHGWKPVAGMFAPDASREGPHELLYPLTLVSLYVKRYHFRPFYLHEGDGLRCRVRVRNLSVVTRPRGFLFGKDRRRVAVLWRPCGVQAITLPLTVIPGSVHKVDLYGQALPNDDPMVLSLSSAPQYVCFETQDPCA
ncbi:MAG: hypothetical protein HY710_02680, partial [Candidatus Latescibacteria bacterium]|nr:hypothetical protein [Candidatus Latescibacterota bacterium]